MDHDMSEMEQTLEDVRQGWIPSHIYSDAAIFDEEQKRIFSRTWQFLGHVSEIPNDGDYVVRNLLSDSFIVVRGNDSKVRILLNLCRHRGGKVCRNESGNAQKFVCPYHAWAFKNDGSLAGVPYHKEAYGGTEGLNKKEFGLYRPPHMEIFNGLIFVNLDPDAEPLKTYLGDFATYLSFYVPDVPGGMEVRGPQRWRFNANWKIGSENFSGDTYHTPHTHASMGAIKLVSSAATSNRKAGVMFAAGRGNGATFRLADGPGSFDERLGNNGFPEEQIKRMRAAWPPEITRMIEQDGLLPSASTLFPNLSFLHISAKVNENDEFAPFTTMRLWMPVSATETEMWSWFVVDKGASEAFKKKSYKAYLMCFGTSGMFEQDDIDAWVTLTKMTQGYVSSAVHLHSRMGMNQDGSPLNEPIEGYAGPGTAHIGFNEYNQRRWLNFWAEHLEMDPPAHPIRSGAKR